MPPNLASVCHLAITRRRRLMKEVDNEFAPASSMAGSQNLRGHRSPNLLALFGECEAEQVCRVAVELRSGLPERLHRAGRRMGWRLAGNECSRSCTAP